MNTICNECGYQANLTYEAGICPLCRYDNNEGYEMEEGRLLDRGALGCYKESILKLIIILQG